ncbi:TetR/AcrR family transcriptional regulator [Nocardiopsis sp. YSL2]|uniref:TetR/AcrR family transcriptional regulator n=1 Tax=Nocardiopsis sp. YSL2 TaxID=2939492 RepID=UPI0026F46096|nr:TetR/AcrR family transcriptional regulator [Nocardiopsis sp. YSL2]
MSRPRDEQRRDELLAGAFDYAAQHGLANLSLRPLARALGTSDRMLMHYFGSKDELVTRILRVSRPDLDTLFASVRGHELSEFARGLWEQMTDDRAQAPRVRLMLEVMALAVHRPEDYGAVAADAHREWIDSAATALTRELGLPAPEASARATALVSGLKGLALDYFVSGDRTRVDAAAEALIATVTLSHRH